MKAVDRLLHAVRRRERLAEAAYLLARWGLPAGLFIAAVALIAIRRFGAPAWVLWLTALPGPTLIGWAMLRRRSWRATARRIDEHYRLDDRLGSALEFAEKGQVPSWPCGPTRRRSHGNDPRTPQIVELLTAEAEATAARLDPRPVVPLRLPGPRLLDAAAFGAVVGAALVPDPEAMKAEPQLEPLVGAAAQNARARAGLDLSMAEPIRQDLRELSDGDDEIAKIAQKMLEVLEALENGELDRAEAFEMLEKLEEELADAEERFEATLEEDPAELAQTLRELAEALEEHEITKDAAAAMQRDDPEATEKALDEAADKAESGSSEEQEALRKAMEEAERRLSKQANNRSDETAKQLDEAERRLRREQKKEAKTPEEKREQERRLRRQKKRVDELRRQHEREMAAQRRADQLRRNAQNAANRSNSGQKRRDAMQKLSRNTGQASKTTRKSRRMGQARDSLEEAKTFIRRAGKQGEGAKRRRQQFRKFSKAAKGKRGKKGKDGKGNKGKSTLLIEGDVGEGEPDMMMEMPGQQGQGQGQQGEGQDGQDGNQPGDQGGGQSSSSQLMPGGDGIGEGSVDPMGDDPTGMRTREKNVHVNAKEGRGVSRAEVIRDSSQQGFATEPYRRVYEDYRGFAQSAIDSEELPAARRRAVKRYYQMIQPRD